MKCAAIRGLIQKKIDHELSESENTFLEDHLEQCSGCVREYGLMSLPSRIAQEITPLEPSPYFYTKLKVHIENTVQSSDISQLLYGLARRVIPSMAAVTLALLSVFAYLNLRSPQDDLYAAYEKVLIGEDIPLHMIITEQRDITDATILNAIANQAIRRNTNYELK